MNRHNGFVTCVRCKCVTRKKKTVAEIPARFSDRRDLDWRCVDQVKCDLQRKIQTERDRRIHAALQAQHDRDVDRQMGYEMKAYFTGMS